MAMEPMGRVGSNILRNPFASAKVEGPQFDDPGKRSPTGGNGQQGGNGGNGNSPTNLDDNPGFVAPGGDGNKGGKQDNGAGDDPMLQFDTLWEDNAPDPKAPKKEEFTGYLPKIDDKAFGDRVNQMDFSKAVKPETMAAIMKGGEEAAAAYPDLINTIGRQAFKMAFNASSKMTEATSRNLEKRFMDDLIPNSIQSRIVDDTVEANNELASNPKYAPLYKQIKARYTTKFPKANPKQVADATKAYMDDYIKNATKKDDVIEDNTKKLQKGSGDADWSTWMEN